MEEKDLLTGLHGDLVQIGCDDAPIIIGVLKAHQGDVLRLESIVFVQKVEVEGEQGGGDGQPRTGYGLGPVDVSQYADWLLVRNWSSIHKLEPGGAMAKAYRQAKNPSLIQMPTERRIVPPR